MRSIRRRIKRKEKEMWRRERGKEERRKIGSSAFVTEH
jgi:hypothetical protein